MARDRILVDGLHVECIVGVYPEERDREQPVHVDVELALDLRDAGLRGDLSRSCDYAAVARDVAALLQFRRYLLLEVAAEEITGFLLAAHPRVAEVSLRLAKPCALPGLARSAGVALRRDRGDLGQGERLLTTAEARLRQVALAPGGALRLGPLAGDTMLWAQGGDLRCGDVELAAGRSLICLKGHVLSCMNLGTGPVSTLLLERHEGAEG
ncbi:MAG: dihydroneopterin aldolase [Nannocystaceae bacterium]